jgi:hypothetical protein
MFTTLQQSNMAMGNPRHVEAFMGRLRIFHCHAWPLEGNPKYRILSSRINIRKGVATMFWLMASTHWRIWTLTIYKPPTQSSLAIYLEIRLHWRLRSAVVWESSDPSELSEPTVSRHSFRGEGGMIEIDQASKEDPQFGNLHMFSMFSYRHKSKFTIFEQTCH